MFKKFGLALAIWLLVVSGLACAEVPIVDLSQNIDQGATANVDATAINQPVSASNSLTKNITAPVSSSAPSSSNTFFEQRIARLEQQLQALNEMNVTERLNSFEQQIQKLNGQSEVNAHDIEMLQEQLRDFYKNLEQRLNQVKIAATAASDHKDLQDAAQQSEPKEQEVYEDAFKLLQNKQYTEASRGFDKYLKDYPEGTFAVNAHYWLGEVAYLQSQFDKAEKQLQIIVAKYPKSIKLGDAMLKLAIIHSADGDQAKVKEEFKAVIKRFPGSSVAKLAEQQLKLLDSANQAKLNKAKPDTAKPKSKTKAK